jgi:hypothetical protein
LARYFLLYVTKQASGNSFSDSFVRDSATLSNHSERIKQALAIILTKLGFVKVYDLYFTTNFISICQLRLLHVA